MNTSLNFIAEACSHLLFPLGKSCSIKGIPTTKEEWENSYSEQVGITTDTKTIIWSENPEDWSITWDQVKAKAEELSTAIPLRNLRFERNRKISETDWTQLPDVSEEIKIMWQDYRQALRDITNTYTSLDDVVWPTKPE